VELEAPEPPNLTSAGGEHPPVSSFPPRRIWKQAARCVPRPLRRRSQFATLHSGPPGPTPGVRLGACAQPLSNSLPLSGGFCAWLTVGTGAEFGSGPHPGEGKLLGGQSMNLRTKLSSFVSADAIVTVCGSAFARSCHASIS
jgi:hypothetical protein